MEKILYLLDKIIYITTYFMGNIYGTAGDMNGNHRREALRLHLDNVNDEKPYSVYTEFLQRHEKNLNNLEISAQMKVLKRKLLKLGKWAVRFHDQGIMLCKYDFET